MLLLILYCLALGARAFSEADKKAYPEFDELLGGYGYDWEAHEVKTEDGWYLTLFRVYGSNGKKPLSYQNRTGDDY